MHQFNTFSIAHPLAARDRRLPRRTAGCGGATSRTSSRPSAIGCAPRWPAPASRLPPAQGTYFQLLDFSAFAPPDDLAFAERLLSEARRRDHPAVTVLRDSRSRCTFVRLCIAKQDGTLDEAAVRLNALRARACEGGDA